MKTALILAGHGSHISPETAGVVWRQVDHLRRMGVADEITAGFWKEQPSFSRVLQTVEADCVTVVPLFTAQGFFTRSVIPAEMGLSARPNVAYARTIGEHPYLGEVVEARVRHALTETGFPPHSTAVGIVGHGTKRSSDSRAATQQQAQRIGSLNLVPEVVAVFLDDTPSIPDVFTLTTMPNLIVVPFFLALGSHTTIDVPNALGLPEGVTRATLEGREVFYTDPVGVEGDLSAVILELARETGMPLYEGRSPGAWNCFPTAGRDALLSTLQATGEMTFGELRLTPMEVAVAGDEGDKVTLTTPSELRHFVRDQPFRSLLTSRDLPIGWKVEIKTPEMLHAVVETVYPGLVAEWARGRDLETTSFDRVIARQVGAFRDLQRFAPVGEVVREVCTRCVKHPTWFDGEIVPLPCAEPCNHFLSTAKSSVEG